jgi:glycosyltransferase involved in cell wall biosynthesis
MSNFNQLLHPVKLSPMSTNPLVSILITNYNYSSFIAEAVESVLNQTYQKFEILICDDGSSDNSIEVIQKLAKKDERIHFIAKENGGQASALNTAFLKSYGEIISILDADDRFLENKLALIVEVFSKNENIGLVAHKLKVVYGEQFIEYIPLQSISEGWLIEDVIWGRTIFLPPASGLSIRREVAMRCFPLPTHFRAGADRVLYYRCAAITKIKSIERSLAIYRAHNSNTSLGIDIDKSITIYKTTLEDIKKFVEEQHGIKLPQDHLKSMGELEINSLILYKKLLNKQTNYMENIKRIKSFRLRVIWLILFLLPKKISLAFYRWWQGASHSRLLLYKLKKLFTIKS